LIPYSNRAPLCNTWLIDGAEPALVDAGLAVPDGIDNLAQRLAGRALVRLLISHNHPDHVSAVDALRARWPGLIPCKWSNSDAGDWERLADGDRIRAGDTVLTVVHTPGHAPDHVCFWDAGTQSLYTGDMLIKGTTVMVPAGRGGHLRSYLASLERLAALNPARAFPGHGPVIDDPAGLIAEYLDHRLTRERQVLACLAEGIETPDGIVARVYPDLAAELRLPARLTVEAHLEKLREEGRLPRRDRL
jgi:glyoxylase-like metal-dependent hydrolase (beta-lactamase superfamily II)